MKKTKNGLLITFTSNYIGDVTDRKVLVKNEYKFNGKEISSYAQEDWKKIWNIDTQDTYEDILIHDVKEALGIIAEEGKVANLKVISWGFRVQ